MGKLFIGIKGLSVLRIQYYNEIPLVLSRKIFLAVESLFHVPLIQKIVCLKLFYKSLTGLNYYY